MKPARFPVLLFAILITLDVVVFLIEKTVSVHAGGTGWRFAWSFVVQPALWMIFAMKLCQLPLWTTILGRVDISLAFPLTSLAYPAAMLAAVLVLGEHLSWQVWLGGILITAGAAVMGPGEAETTRAPVQPHLQSELQP